MKRINSFYAILPALLFTGFLISCKKDKDKKSACRIGTITESGTHGTVIHIISYNEKGQVDTINTSGATTERKVFTYSANTIISTTTGKQGQFERKDSVTLNDKGKPVNIRLFHTTSSDAWTNFAISYTNNEPSQIIQRSNGSMSVTVIDLTYTDGNMTTYDIAGGTTHLTYYTDKKKEQWDYLDFSHFLQYSTIIFPHKNLLKSIAPEGDDANTLSYEFNQDGSISKTTAVIGATVSTLSYQYQCD